MNKGDNNNKELHGRFYRALHGPDVDFLASVSWLRFLVARIIHQQLALQYNLVGSEVPYYKYVPDPVLENGHAALYWGRSIITDRTILVNKPDIVVIDRRERRAMIVDITVPHDENLVKAENDKKIKYLD